MQGEGREGQRESGTRAEGISATAGTPHLQHPRWVFSHLRVFAQAVPFPWNSVPFQSLS